MDWLKGFFSQRQKRSVRREGVVNPKRQFKTQVPTGRGERRSYSEIKEQHNIGNGESSLYEDPEFRATAGSLFYSASNRPGWADEVEWLRPHDICSGEEPALFKDENGDKCNGIGKGASQFDIVQGNVGDCWLLAALASVACHEEIIAQIIPTIDEKTGEPLQGFEEDLYCGCFLVQIWQYGTWVDVLVDDRLPCINGELVYLKSATRSEFWSAIVEKAYAKLNGSYEALKGGSTAEAMCDFTGGVCETFDMGDHGFQSSNINPDKLHHDLAKSFERGAIGGASIEIPGAAMEAQARFGLIAGHAYSLTAAVKTNTGAQLVCLRNPWGQVEWEGKWRDDDDAWDEVDENESKIFREEKEDGEFWMDIEDFTTYFSKVELCNLSTTKIHDDDDAQMNWVSEVFEKRWLRGLTAGGCTNFKDSFFQNPQFLLKLDEIDDDPDVEGEGCTFIASLLQKDPNRRRLNNELLTIGFIMYKLDDDEVYDFTKPGGQLGRNFFNTHRSCCRSEFINSREVSKRATLAPGQYVIVPCTFRPNEESEFVLRLFLMKKPSESMQGSGEEESEIDDEDDTSQKPIAEKNEQIFYDFFSKLAGRDQAVSAWELQDLLNRVVKKSYEMDDVFTLEACRALVALSDEDKSGRLNFDEFKVIWLGVRSWIETFLKFDQDLSKSFSCFELRAALSDRGFRISTNLMGILVIRYASDEMTVSLSDFVLMGTRLQNAHKSFKKIQPNMSLDSWMTHMLYT